MNSWIRALQQQFASDFTLTSLRVTITLWALFIIVLAWVINNKWILAGILAYEVLP